MANPVDPTASAYPGAFYPGQVFPGQIYVAPVYYRSYFLDARAIRSTVVFPRRKPGGTA